MVTLLLISSWPLVSVMAWPFRLGVKTIVSLLLAAAISARSEPAPLSRLFMTVSVLGTSRSSSASSRGQKVVGRSVRGFGFRAGARLCNQEVSHMSGVSVWRRSASDDITLPGTDRLPEGAGRSLSYVGRGNGPWER